MTITLSVTTRDAEKTTEELRANGKMPAVIYGPKQDPVSIELDAQVFDKVRKEAGESTILTLEGLESPVEVLIKEVTFDPVKQVVTHADLYAIERGKEMTTTVPLHFEGESPAEKNNVGTVTKVMQEITVTCRPSNLPSEVTVDVTTLVDADSQIHVSDLPKLEGVVYEAEATEVVAVVSVAQEEVEEESEAVDMDAVEVEQKGKGEEATV